MEFVKKTLKSIEVPDFQDDPTKGGATIVMVEQTNDWTPQIVLKRKRITKTGEESVVPFVDINAYAAPRVADIIKKFGEVILEQVKKKKQEEAPAPAADMEGLPPF